MCVVTGPREHSANLLQGGLMLLYFGTLDRETKRDYCIWNFQELTG